MVITVILDAAMEEEVHVSGLTPGKSHRAERTKIHPGGRGLVAAMAAHTLSGRCAVLGAVAGAEVEYIRDELDRLGIPNDLILSHGRMPVNLRLIDGERETFIRAQGSTVTEGQLEQIWQKLNDLAEPGDVVLLAGELPRAMTPERLVRWTERLSDEGVFVVLETEMDRRDLTARPAVLITGPAALCGMGLAAEREAVIEAARQLIADGVRGVVVPQAGGRVLFVRKDEALCVTTPRPLDGSAMAARIAVGLSHDESWKNIAVCSVAAGTGLEPVSIGQQPSAGPAWEVEQIG